MSLGVTLSMRGRTIARAMVSGEAMVRCSSGASPSTVCASRTTIPGMTIGRRLCGWDGTRVIRRDKKTSIASDGSGGRNGSRDSG